MMAFAEFNIFLTAWRELSTLARISLYPSSLFFDTGRFLVGSIEVTWTYLVFFKLCGIVAAPRLSHGLQFSLTPTLCFFLFGYELIVTSSVVPSRTISLYGQLYVFRYEVVLHIYYAAYSYEFPPRFLPRAARRQSPSTSMPFILRPWISGWLLHHASLYLIRIL